MGAALLVLIALVCAARRVSGSLQEILEIQIGIFSNTSGLTSQLQLASNLSIDIIQKRTKPDSALLQQLQDVCNATSLHDTLRLAEASASSLRPSVESDIVAILARRALLACIAQQWLAAGTPALDDEMQHLISNLTTKLYDVHVSSVVRRGYVDYLHISKSGGTSFSSAARFNRCPMGHGIGQPIDLGDLPHWVNRTAFRNLTGGVHITWSLYGRVQRTGNVSGCEAREMRVRSKGWRYLSNEYTLHGGVHDMHETHVCPQGVNVVTLRPPADRLLSHLHFLQSHMKTRLGDRRSAGAPALLFHSTFCTSNLTTWEAVAPAIVDNYLVRSFLGERGFHSPVGSLGAPQLDVARRLLLQFDLVLDLGAGDGEAQLMMSQGLGWQVTLSEVHHRTADKVASRLHYDRTECANEEMVRELLPRQEPDRQLYSLGHTASLLDRLLLGWAREIGLKPLPPPSPPSRAPQANTTSSSGSGSGSSTQSGSARRRGLLEQDRDEEGDEGPSEAEAREEEEEEDKEDTKRRVKMHVTHPCGLLSAGRPQAAATPSGNGGLERARQSSSPSSSSPAMEGGAPEVVVQRGAGEEEGLQEVGGPLGVDERDTTEATKVTVGSASHVALSAGFPPSPQTDAGVQPPASPAPAKTSPAAQPS